MTLADVKGVLPEKKFAEDFVRTITHADDELAAIQARSMQMGYNQAISDLGNLDCFTLLEKLLEAGCAELSVCEKCKSTGILYSVFMGLGGECPDCRNGILIKRKD